MSKRGRLLIVEDETRIADWIKTYAVRDGYDCLLAADGETALLLAEQEQPDLIVLDIMLPIMDGWEVCAILRAKSDIPIIMLTARITEDDIIKGLKLGADDYITKPFSPTELLARIEATLRRVGLATNQFLSGGGIELDCANRRCNVHGKPVTLTAKQFELLEFLMRHPHQVFSRKQLIDNVFGIDYNSRERAIDIHVRRLRMKIEEDPSNPRYIQTAFGAGYRFCPEGE